MTRDQQRDWELLNAYCDSELNAADQAALERRLEHEPALRQDLNRLHNLKRELAGLRPPEPDGMAVQAATSRKRLKGALASTAALLVIAALTVAVLVAWPSAQRNWLQTAMDMHDTLSHQTYVVEEGHVTQIVSSGRDLAFSAPDLTASRLYLVDVVTSTADGGDAVAMHYRGMRGCRLTVVALPEHPDGEQPDELGGLIHAWSYSGYNFAVIAVGMDAQRFASVASYAEAAVIDAVRRHRELQIAMTESYNAARPCA